jgi:hypothetical protein
LKNLTLAIANLRIESASWHFHHPHRTLPSSGLIDTNFLISAVNVDAQAAPQASNHPDLVDEVDAS